MTIGSGRILPMAQEDATARPPVFRRIAIVGVGLMGGSLGLAARRAWPDALVVGIDRNDVLEQAMRLHAVDVGGDDLIMARDAELVVLAVPLLACLEQLARLDDALDGPAIVTDLCPVKRPVMEAARHLPSRFTFVGGHPLAGAPRAGIEYARPDLYEGRPWVLSPSAPGADVPVRLQDFVSGVGARPVVQTPEEHDRLVAYLSHLPQIVASALMTAVGEGAREDGLALAGKSLVDATRLAASPGDVWAEVLAANADEVRPALDAVIEFLAGVRDGLASPDAVEALFASANRWRERLGASRGNP
jgi:prephenate dehydrogenase